MTVLLDSAAPTAEADATPALTLDVHICDERRSYLVSFATEQQALDFIARQAADAEAQRTETGAAPWAGGHAYSEIESSPIPEGWDRLYDLLYPKCEHGLSAALCYGPEHYCRPDEIAQGW